MAKRGSKKRKTTKKRASNTDLTVVGLIILSVLLCVLIYGKSGVIGIELNEILGGMIGIITLISVYQINIGELSIIGKDLSNVVKDAYSIRFTRKWRRCAWCNSCYTTC